MVAGGLVSKFCFCHVIGRVKIKTEDQVSPSLVAVFDLGLFSYLFWKLGTTLSAVYFPIKTLATRISGRLRTA